MGRRLAAIIIKEFVQLARDRRTLLMALLMPVIQLLLFAYAITTDVEHLPTIVLDHSRSQESRALLQRFANSRYFDIRKTAGNEAEIEREIDHGASRVGIVIPPDYDDLLAAGPRRGHGDRPPARSAQPGVVQPGSAQRELHGPRAARRHPQHAHADAHRDGHRARARAGDPGAARGHAHPENRADARQRSE